MNFKNKFHLTLVVLITLFNSFIGISPVDTANALTVDNSNVDVYNLTKVAGGNIYNINNINIKYISLKLTNVSMYNMVHKQKVKMTSVLSLKDKIEILMYSIKTIETNGRYKAKSQWSDACGAYQYMPITWDNYGGFKTACLAPEWVQAVSYTHLTLPTKRIV